MGGPPFQPRGAEVPIGSRGRQGMVQEIRGQAGTIMCPHCEQTGFDIAGGETEDPIITCSCGTVLGTLYSLRAYCDDEALTHATARLKKSS